MSNERYTHDKEGDPWADKSAALEDYKRRASSNALSEQAPASENIDAELARRKRRAGIPAEQKIEVPTDLMSVEENAQKAAQLLAELRKKPTPGRKKTA